MDLGSLSEVIDHLAASDPDKYGDAESMEVLHRELARLDSFVTAAVAAFDASGDWAADGAKTPAAWLATRCRLRRGRAKGVVRRGRALRSLPACAEAFADGAITADHVDAFSSIRNPTTEDALARDEELLVSHARNLRFESFMKALAYWAQFADPDGTEDDAERRRTRRDVSLAESFGGMWLGKITLDPLSGAIVSNELKRLEAELFEVDWADTRERIGRDPLVTDLARTPAQRRADALVEMATRSKCAPEDARRPAPLFSVLVGYETLHGRICQLAHGTVVTPGSLLPWLDEALVERAVFDPPRRVEIGATARLFTGATRRAIEIRDRQCTHPYCDTPESDCQVDHIVAYADGGPTTQDNGRLLCGFHNRLRNGRPPPGG